MTSPALRRRSVDDYLGPPGGRFFSAGYRRVSYEFSEIVAEVRDGCAGSSLSARVGLSYPGDWSRKSAGVTLRPHLSTVDAILLGIELSEACLVQAFCLDPQQRRHMWVRSVIIRAGSAPEEELAQVPAQARLTRTAADGDGLVSVVTSQVGAMRVRCEVAHATGPVVAASRSYARLTDVLGPAGPRYYGNGFSRGGQLIEDLTVDAAELNANASVMVLPADAADQGIEGAYHPSATPVDCFVTGLQLAQILLYGLDGMTRAASDTLWMRSTAIDMAGPDRPVTGPLRLTTALRDVSLLTMTGARWRTADIHASLGGIAVTCAVTHRLPGPDPDPAAGPDTAEEGANPS